MDMTTLDRRNMTTTMTTISLKKDLFSSLPGEIRNQIYADLLVYRGPIPPTLRHHYYSSNVYGAAAAIHPAILRTSKAIYAEAVTVLYMSNTFLAHPTLLASMPRLRTHLPPLLSPNPIARIRRFYVYVRLDCDVRFTASEAAAAFSGLDEFTLEVFQPTYDERSEYLAVLSLFAGVRGVGRARVIGSLEGCRPYAELLEGAMMMPVGWGVDCLDISHDTSFHGMSGEMTPRMLTV